MLAIQQTRSGIRDTLDGITRRYRAWAERNPRIVSAFILGRMAFFWLGLLAFLISLIFLDDTRKMFVQFLWTYYILMQLWVLCPSKTLTWKQYASFFLAGVWLCTPLSVLFVYAVIAVLGVNPTDPFWSTAHPWVQETVVPVVEELIKLAPLGVYLALSRRASSLSITDFALIGGASGAGFQYLEETGRRMVRNGPSLGDLFTKIEWQPLSLFPGAGIDQINDTILFAGHGVLTAMVAVAIGFAVKSRKRLGWYVFTFPLVLLLWSILDHSIYNDTGNIPNWLTNFHDFLGGGGLAKSILLITLAGAIVADYRTLNRVKSKLPTLRREPVLNPFTELWRLTTTLVKHTSRFGELRRFYRERRELAFTLAYGNSEARSRMPALRLTLQTYKKSLVGVGLVLLVASFWTLGHYPQLLLGVDHSACFSCLFDMIQNWWDGLPWYGKVLVGIGVFALSAMFIEFWPAIDIALATTGMLGSGHTIADIMRNPRKLLSLRTLGTILTNVILSRFPEGRVLGRNIFRRAERELGEKERRSLRDIIRDIFSGRKRPRKPDLPPRTRSHLEVPQGLTREQFTHISGVVRQRVRDKLGPISDDIVVQGSRAGGTAGPNSDIDLAIRVSPDTFERLVRERFKTPNPGSAKEKTMLHAIATGKIQSGEAGLRAIRKELERELGMEVDLSIIKTGGAFDNGPYIQLP